MFKNKKNNLTQNIIKINDILSNNIIFYIHRFFIFM